MFKKNAFLTALNSDEERSAKQREKAASHGRTGSAPESKDASGFYKPGDLDWEPPRGPSRPHSPKKNPPLATPAKYPWFKRCEPVGIQLRKEPYVIEKLPEIGATPSINWVQVLATPAAMLVLAVIMMAFGMASMLVMLPMQLVGIVTAVISYYSQKKKYDANSNNSEKKYKEYLAEVETELEKIAQDQKDALWQSNPAGTACMAIIRDRKDILWSKDMQSEDFLEISLGIGQTDLSCPIDVYRPGRFENNVNPLSSKAVDLADRYKQIQEVPILFSLLQNNSIAVRGKREHTTAMIQQMLVSLSTLHTPEDLKIAIVYSKEEEKDWSFFRFLPHVQEANKTGRLIAVSDAESNVGIKSLLNSLAVLADSRQNEGKSRVSLPAPFYVLVITDRKYLNQITDGGRLLPSTPGKGMTTLIATPDSIPDGCQHVIEVQLGSKGALQGKVYPTSNRDEATQFRLVPLPRENVEDIVRTMAPIRLESGREGRGLPTFISLFKGRQISTVEELKIEDNWKRSRASDSMAVSLGVGSDGEEVILDIHEKHDGPMGLVAGTTRAGKTELLQTWIIQMALKFSPEEVNFVLFDFKGTSLIEPLKTLPHLVGYISDTERDDSGQDFELRYCAALRSEMDRRKRLLSGDNILEYQEKYHNNQVTEPLPFLMIILDEFAQIKDTHPEFMELATALYRTGGGLGMYVILSTQNPASAMNADIKANMAFQLCARVADNQDSREMIGVPDAALLPKIPGRAFLRVRAQGTLQCFQSYYSGAAYDVETHTSENAMPIALIEVNGDALTVKTEKPRCTELEAAVAHIRRVASAMKIPAAHKVWLSPLEKKTSIYDILKIKPGEEPLRTKVNTPLTAVIGLTDDPAHQVQYNTKLNFTEYGSAVVYGGPKSGKTGFLLTASVSLVHLYSPERVRMYFIDGGSGVLKSLEKFPHTARVLGADTQPEDCWKIMVELQAKVEERQREFDGQSVQDYRKKTGKAIPDILLVIDDVGEVKNRLEGRKFSEAGTVIDDLLRSGPQNGVYLLLSACRQRDLYKLSGSISKEMCFALCMSETDAGEILGLPRGIRPPFITIPGRGLCVGTSGERQPLVFQTAQPWTVDDTALQIDALRKLGQGMTQKCGRVFDDQPQEIPEHIPYGTVPALENGIILGLALDGRGAVGNYLDLDTSVLTVVGGDAALRLSVVKMITGQIEQSDRYEEKYEIAKPAEAVPVVEKLRAEAKANMRQECVQKKFFLVIHDLPEVYRSLSDEHRTLLDQFVVYGGKRYGIDCLFTAAPEQLAALPQNNGEKVMPAGITLFRNPMLYLDDAVAASNERFKVGEQKRSPMGEEDAEYVAGFEFEQRNAIRIRRMLNR